MSDDAVRLIAMLHHKGASIRTIAKAFGLSKSTLARWMPAILEQWPAVPDGTLRAVQGPPARVHAVPAVPDGTRKTA
jgi:transposase-like protein